MLGLKDGRDNTVVGSSFDHHPVAGHLKRSKKASELCVFPLWNLGLDVALREMY